MLEFPKASRNQDLPYSFEATFLLKTKVVRRQGTLTSSGSVTLNMQSVKEFTHSTQICCILTMPQAPAYVPGTRNSEPKERAEGKRKETVSSDSEKIRVTGGQSEGPAAHSQHQP